MNHERILVHKSPENSVFGLKGSDVTTDEEKFYIKTENDTRNSGWKEIPPTPTPTQTVSVTPSKTMIVTRTPYATYVPPTPTPTISITPTITPSSAPGTSTTPTPTPTETPFRTTVNYTVISNNVAFGTAEVIGAPSTGIISVGDRLTLKATINTGSYFQGWSVPESVSISSSIYQLNPVVQLVSLGGGNVTITGSFASGSLPTYYADGSADSFGVLDFYYIVWSGELLRYYNSLLRPGETVSRVACANRILSVQQGTVTLTSNSC